MPRFLALRVLGRLRQGSSSPVVVETEAGRFVAKLRGAGHGVPALVAEIVVAELAQALGLAVPERVLIELPKDVESEDRNDELADLLAASTGKNLGLRLLAGSRVPRPEEIARLDDDFVARVLWLDGLVMNADRSEANPNLLLWNGQPWLIDHGAALPFQYDWRSLSEHAPREPMDYDRHVFRARTALLAAHDAALATRIGATELETATELVPDEFVLAANPESNAERARAAYRAFLRKRLAAPRPFVG